MTSSKQIEANRRNARKSTGPRTGAGKARSSRNAVKHGVLSSAFVSGTESEAVYAQLLEDLINEFRPATPYECLLVEKLAISIWRERRLVESETALMAGAPHSPFPTLLERNGLLPIKQQMLIGRYQTMLTNQTFRILNELKSLQAERIEALEAVNLAEAGPAPS